MYRWNTNSHLSVKEESQRGEYATYIVTCLSLTYRSWVPTWPPSEFLLEFYRELAAISLPPFSSVLIHHFLVEVHCECKDYSYWKAEYKKIDEGKNWNDKKTILNLKEISKLNHCYIFVTPENQWLEFFTTVLIHI